MQNNIFFKDLDIGDKFSFLKINTDYTLVKTGKISWKVLSSNCRTYKVGQKVSASNEQGIARLLSLKVRIKNGTNNNF